MSWLLRHYIYRYPTFEFGGILYILTWTAWDRDDVNQRLLLFFIAAYVFTGAKIYISTLALAVLQPT